MTESEYKKFYLDKVSKDTLNMRISVELLNYLRHRAEILGISYSEYLRLIIVDDMFKNNFSVKQTKTKDEK